MESGPEKPGVQRFKLDRKRDPKRSDRAKRLTLERKKTRSLKRLRNPGTNPGNAS
jgi:hypothetical protein